MPHHPPLLLLPPPSPLYLPQFVRFLPGRIICFLNDWDQGLIIFCLRYFLISSLVVAKEANDLKATTSTVIISKMMDLIGGP